MSQEQYSTRLPEDDAERLERYCDEQGISKSEALRRSVRELTESDGPEQNRLWQASVVAALAFILIGQSGLVPGIVVAGLGLVVIAGLITALGYSWSIIEQPAGK